MKHIFLVGATILGLSGPVAAADIAVADLPVAPRSYYANRAAEYSWSGFYFGVNGGYGLGNSDWSDPNNPSGANTTGNFHISGPVVGGTIGGNFQFGQVVLGAEADFDYSQLKGTTSPANGFCALTTASFAMSTSCESENTWMATVRARIGYAFYRTLVYGTGGLAVGGIRAGVTGPGITPTFDSTTEPGWTAGGGLELALSNHWTVRAEYLYISLSHGACTSANCGYDGLNPATFALIPAADTVKFSTSLVRLGVDYKFSWE
ncbi:MAG TPA: outer membrane protein [Candidatus Binataceae bacterium]|nr:outer membrane protein [Candidatus Binataceae bacterium]